MGKIIKKRFDISVTQPNTVVSKNFELDKNITAIKGMIVSSDRDDLLYYRGSQKLEINRDEIFPENYECKLLMSGVNVPPQSRYYDLGGMPPGNGIIKIDFKDGDMSFVFFQPYRVSYYFECETNE